MTTKTTLAVLLFAVVIAALATGAELMLCDPSRSIIYRERENEMTDPVPPTWWELREQRGLTADEATSVLMLLRGGRNLMSGRAFDALFLMTEEGRLTPEEGFAWAKYLDNQPKVGDHYDMVDEQNGEEQSPDTAS